MSGAAAAATRPADPTAELKSLTTWADGDVQRAILSAEGQKVLNQVFTQPTEPLASVMGTVCSENHIERRDGYGRYVARHVREPRRGRRLVLTRLSADFRRNVRTVSRTLPDGEPRFLIPGESLSQPPATWEQAARQRAEWASVLGTLNERLVADADRTGEYETYVVAGMWTRLDCLLARTDHKFLRDFEAAGAEAGDERTAAALELLARRGADHP